jgi:hypothetical protein
VFIILRLLEETTLLTQEPQGHAQCICDLLEGSVHLLDAITHKPRSAGRKALYEACDMLLQACHHALRAR